MNAAAPPLPPARPAPPDAGPGWFFQRSEELLAVWDAEGRLQALNPAWGPRLGLAPAETLGRPYWDLAHPEDRLPLLDRHRHLLQGGAERAGFEGRFRTGDGAYRWLLWSVTWDPEGRQGFGVAQDITERKETELRLRASEAQFRSTLAALEEGVVVRDREGRVLSHNAAAERILGGPPWLLDCPYEALPDLILPDGTPIGPEDLPVSRALRTGMAVPGTLLGFRRPGGSRAWIQVAAQPLLAEGHLQGVVCSIADVTGHREALEALHQSERELRSLLDTLPDPMVRMDARGVFLECRAPSDLPLEFPLEALVGRSVAQVLPELADPALAAIRSCLEEGRPQSLAYQLLGPEGRPRHLEARIIPHAADEVLVILRDISDLKAHEAAIRHALREKEVLLKEIHHRVKNNLQVVSSLLRLQAGAHAEPAVRGALQEAQERIQAIALIHGTLKHAPDASRLDLEAYVRTLAERLVRSHASTPTLVDLQVRVDPVRLGPDDAVPLGLLLNELVSNALQHAFPPGEGGCLEIGVEDQGAGQVLVRVADSGVGLPEEVDLDHGRLGFQLVRALAEQLGGSLELERRRGAAFRLTFTPRASSEAHDA